MTMLPADAPPHPFYPIDASLVNYVANEKGTGTLLATFGAGIVAVMVTTYLFTQALSPDLPKRHQALAMWFAVCRVDRLPIRMSSR